MQGEGHLTWPDGKSYLGQFWDDKRHGLGKLTYLDGRSYDGPWVNGK